MEIPQHDKHNPMRPAEVGFPACSGEMAESVQPDWRDRPDFVVVVETQLSADLKPIKVSGPFTRSQAEAEVASRGEGSVVMLDFWNVLPHPCEWPAQDPAQMKLFEEHDDICAMRPAHPCYCKVIREVREQERRGPRYVVVGVGPSGEVHGPFMKHEAIAYQRWYGGEVTKLK
jgi:hypothetical protein